ncbi:MAG TPA: PadR family transcriptional regulator [Blastocatellia bacterium]
MAKDDLQGALDLLVLKTLVREPIHGYGLVRRIQQITDGVLTVEEGSLYPALHRMEMAGWIEPEWKMTEAGRRAKYYGLTALGKKQLAVEEKNWERVTAAIAKVLRLA